MREAQELFEAAEVDVIVVATGAGWQAERLMDEGMPFECLVDPEAALYRALDIGRVGWGEWLRPTTIRRYVAAFRRGGRQGRITGDWRRLSGVVLLDPARRVRWIHRSDGVGDYPSVTELRTAIGAD
ncbi:MAG: AhpC/TSA family protein [Acidimicrobiia bacterium]|nr:AhpC/TSA family protein [Acidimicrobiia bacterium]